MKKIILILLIFATISLKNISSQDFSDNQIEAINQKLDNSVKMVLSLSDKMEQERFLQIHEQWLQNRNKCVADNPDNPRGVYYKSTVVRINTYCQVYNSLLNKRNSKTNNNNFNKSKENIVRDIKSLGANGLEQYKKGKVQEAIALMEKALYVSQNKLGEEDPETATCLSNLADFYKNIHKYNEAIQLLQKASFIWAKNLGDKHPYVAGNLKDEAIIYSEIGDHKNSLVAYQAALEIMKSNFGSEHPNTADFYHDIAEQYELLDRYPDAINNYQKAYNIFSKSLGINHERTLVTENDMACVYLNIGENERAEEHYKNIISIREAQPNINYDALVVSLLNYGNMFLGADNNKAISIYQSALKSYEKSIHKNEIEISPILVNLSAAYGQCGDHKKALEYIDRAILESQKNGGANSIILINKAHILCNLGNYDEALKIANKILEYNKDINLETCSLLCRIYGNIGQYNKSKEYANYETNLINKSLPPMLTLGEIHRLSWAKKLNYNDAATFLDTSAICQLILQWKGIVLDSLIEDRIVSKQIGKNDNRISSQIQILKSKIASLLISSKNIDLSEAESLQQQIDTLESSYAKNLSNRSRLITHLKTDDLKNSLLPDEAVLDLISFNNPLISKNMYGFSVISKTTTNQWVTVAEAAMINSAVYSMRKAISSGDETSLKEQIQILSDKLWKPIAAALPPDIKKIYIGADGPLNFLSFATLQDDQGKFLSEKYQIAYVGSGRDLLRPAKPFDKKDMVIYANPVFSSEEGAKHSLVSSNIAMTDRGMKPVELAEFSRVQLPQLPGTEQEAVIVSQIAKESQWSYETHLGADASKKGLMSMKAPAVLHLATHGFFLGGEESGGEGVRGMKVAITPDVPTPTASANPKPLKISPMRQSGVALTGGQSTLQAWGRGEFPDPSNDGILTAEEVSGLDLNGTWLVTLSACETGVGKVQSGEGVFGLRRAFMMAGAQNLLMTLWPVSDEVTPKIMADFYKKALATGDAAGSLSDVQRDWLVKLRNEKGLLAAVRDAGPFAMAVMANPNVKCSSDASTPQPKENNTNSSASVGSTDTNISAASSAVVATGSETMPATYVPSNVTSNGNPTPVSQAEGSKVLSFNDASIRAEAGDAYAQAILSIYYKVGFNTPIDFDLAGKYALKSAAQNNPLGIYQLGKLRAKGQGMEKNVQQGVALQKKALVGIKAMTGDPYAMTFVGQSKGNTNPEEAFALYQEAAQLGYPVAIGLLSNCYYYGTGVPKNPQLASRYMKMAADMGLGLAQRAEALIQSAGYQE